MESVFIGEIECESLQRLSGFIRIKVVGNGLQLKLFKKLDYLNPKQISGNLRIIVSVTDRYINSSKGFITKNSFLNKNFTYQILLKHFMNIFYQYIIIFF